MRVILKQNSTGLYYHPGGSWTANPKEAMDFGSDAEATQFAHAHGFVDFRLERKADFFQELAKRVRVYFAHFG